MQEVCEGSLKRLNFLAEAADPFLRSNSRVLNLFFHDRRRFDVRLPALPHVAVQALTPPTASDNPLEDFMATTFGAWRTRSIYQIRSTKIKVLLGFWGVDDSSLFPVVLAGAHGRILETNMVPAIYDVLRFFPSDDTQFDIGTLAIQAQQAIELELGYDNPILTFNALFAPRALPWQPDRSVIVLGDGLLDFVASLVVGGDDTNTNNAAAAALDPVGILAHEFGHYLQFRLDLEDQDFSVQSYIRNRDTSPEGTRQSELEADALAAYGLAHEARSDVDIDLLVRVGEAYGHVGDCSVASSGHHGTSTQRECATRWGADTGLDDSGQPLSPQQFREPCQFSRHFGSGTGGVLVDCR